MAENAHVSQAQVFDPCPPVAESPRDAQGRLRVGLVIDWRPFNFVNPPWYAKCIPRWIDKAYQEKLKGNTTWMLAPMNVSRVWFKERRNKNIWDNIKFYDGPRVKFIHQVTGKPMFSVHTQFFFLIFDGALRTPALTPLVVKETLCALPEPSELARTRSEEEFRLEYIEDVQSYDSQQFESSDEEYAQPETGLVERNAEGYMVYHGSVDAEGCAPNGTYICEKRRGGYCGGCDYCDRVELRINCGEYAYSPATDECEACEQID